jgi:hypothetical protein
MAESQEHHLKAPASFIGIKRQNCTCKLHYPSPIPSMLEISPGFEKMILCCGPLHRMHFEFEYHDKFEVKIEMTSGLKQKRRWGPLMKKPKCKKSREIFTAR